MPETPTGDDLYERLLQSILDARAERDRRRDAQTNADELDPPARQEN